MKPSNSFFKLIKAGLLLIAGTTFTLLLASFTLHKKMTEDFLKQLGISKTDATSKITNSMLDGYLDGSGIKNIKTIALGNRKSIASGLLVYTKQHLASAAFQKEYNALRESKKPEKPSVKTPEEFQQEIIAQAKKSIADLEQTIKKADANMKPVFEKTLESVRKQLVQAEDPNHKSNAGYRNGYPALIQNRDNTYAKNIATWEAKYPANHQVFIKQRLLQFMEETRDIDFDATLVDKKGIKYFTNPDYERKSDRWKMAFRAGRDVVETSREFVQTWLTTLP